jgi:hypothetical protein
MNELIAKALERKAELLRELEAINNLINALSPANRAITPPSDSSTQLKLWEAESTQRVSKRDELKLVLDEVEALILAAGTPLTRGQLVPALTSRGFKLDGADRNKVLGTNIWRSKRFVNLPGFGYWPKGVPIPVRSDQGVPVDHNAL